MTTLDKQLAELIAVHTTMCLSLTLSLDTRHGAGTINRLRDLATRDLQSATVELTSMVVLLLEERGPITEPSLPAFIASILLAPPRKLPS